MSLQTLLYDTIDGVATITLNRPEQLNTIVPPMPDELEAAVHRAVADSHVKVIVLRGAGRAFDSGPPLTILPAFRGPPSPAECTNIPDPDF